jgi:serine O-acetyltransferase
VGLLTSDVPGTLRAVIREDLANHGGRLRSPAFRALAVYRFGRWRDGLASGPVRKLLWPVYETLRRHIRGRYRIELHHTAAIGRRVLVPDEGDVVVGNDSVIGDGCVLAAGATMAKTKVGRPGRPEIGARVVIGPGATFIGGVRVGDDAVIGPNAVVFTDVPSGGVLLAPASTAGPGDTPGPRPGPLDPDRFGRLPDRDVPDGSSVGHDVRVARCGIPRLLGPVEIGDGCVLHERVTLGWDPPYDPRGAETRTRLGARVHLSPGAVVLRGVSIGDDVWVGPNAVVDEDVPSGWRVGAPTGRVFSALRASSAT